MWMSSRVRKAFDTLSLQAKLILMMLLLLFTSMAMYLYFHFLLERAMRQQIKDQIEELSTAIQISVEELTTHGVSDETRLRAYVKKLKKKGVTEISILSKEQQVIASSNPLKRGARMDIRHKEPDKDLMIRATLGEAEPGEAEKAHNLIVPVIVGNEQIGYIHIVLHLEDVEKGFRGIFIRRVILTILIFGAGIAATVYLSRRYTRPIYEVVSAARRVASGDLSGISAGDRGDEIGELTTSFNEMVKKLRENTELQERLRKAEQFSRLGQLASGIAHEIRNPLNFVNLSIDHLAGRFSPRKNAQEFTRLLGTMKEEVHRLNQLVGTFLSLGKPITVNPTPTSLSPLLNEVVTMAGEKIKEQKVSVTIALTDPLPPVLVDPEQIKSCLVNVVINALQAMPAGGRLTVTADRNGTGFLSLTFADTGDGIPQDHLPRVFEPYFTTKSGGIGLGLAVTKRIVEEHKGRIEIRSEIGRGTTVTFLLPTS